MQIPEISSLFVISMCGLSLVCTGVFGVLAFMVLRFTSGELFEFAGGLFGGGDDSSSEPSVAPGRVPASRRDLRAKADSFDFDAAVRGGTQSAANPSYGENTSLRPDGRPRFNPDKRDLDLRPPGRQSDDPNALHTPPPPDFNPNNEYLPNTNSNVGDRVGRHNTGRGQTGQRMDSYGGSTLSGSDDGTDALRKRFRGDRNSRRDDERFGGQYDFDGDGDLDT